MIPKHASTGEYAPPKIDRYRTHTDIIATKARPKSLSTVHRGTKLL